MIRQLIVAATLVSLFGVAGLATGCSSLPDDARADSDEGPVGKVSQKVDTICGGSASQSIDGIPAYGYCGNFDVWTNNGVDVHAAPGAGTGWVRTEAGYGFQCFELTSRYMHFKWGVSTSWNVLYASQMCNNHPAGVVVTQNPVHGDLIVFAGGSCGIAAPAGHVAVVDSVGASTVTAVQQNVVARLTWPKSCASCFLHAIANGSSDPCASAQDGFFCAASPQFAGGKKGEYFDCRGGATKSKVTCSGGCEVKPPGVEDVCHEAPPAADAGATPPETDASAPAVEAPKDVVAPQPVSTGVAPTPPPSEEEPTPDSQSSAGCSASPRTSAPGASWLLVIAGAALLRAAVRRRHAPSTRTPGK